MSSTTVIILQNDQADWYSKHPNRLINAILSRMHSGEIDRYPGYARWHGDGCPGLQVVWNDDNSVAGIISVRKGSGQCLTSVNNVEDTSNEENKLALLKALASRLGYSLVKKRPRNNKNTKKNQQTSEKKSNGRKS